MKRKIIVGLISLACLLIIGGIVYFYLKTKTENKISPQSQVKEEKNLEGIMKSLTAPQTGKNTQLSAETIKSLTAPQKGQVSEDILKTLTAPSPR